MAAKKTVSLEESFKELEEMLQTLESEDVTLE